MQTDREVLNEILAKIQTQVTTVPVTDTIPVKPNPNPTPAPAPEKPPVEQPVDPVSNPYLSYKAQGLSLNDVSDYIFKNGMKRAIPEADWPKALAAGYTRQELTSSMPTSDLSYRDQAEMTWDARSGGGDLYYLTGKGGSKFFTVPENYVGVIQLENVPNPNSKHNNSTATLDGQQPVTLGGGGPTHHQPITPGRHEYHVDLDIEGGCTVILRHYP